METQHTLESSYSSRNTANEPAKRLKASSSSLSPCAENLKQNSLGEFETEVVSTKRKRNDSRDRSHREPQDRTCRKQTCRKRTGRKQDQRQNIESELAKNKEAEILKIKVLNTNLTMSLI
jgi:hypothetical protein